MRKIKIYIVEDYTITRILYKKYALDSEGIELLGDFDNAEDCICQMLKQRADVVLIDLKLPYMSGIEAARIIGEEFPETKVITISSNRNRDEIIASLSFGTKGCVSREMNLATFRHAIKAVDMGALWLDPAVSNITKSIFPKPVKINSNKIYYEKSIEDVLTERELEVLRLVADGKSNVEIGEIIMVSTNTAKAHVGNILNKLNVKDRVQAAVIAVREGIV